MRTIFNRKNRPTVPQVAGSMQYSIGEIYDLAKSGRLCYIENDRDIGSRSEDFNDCEKRSFARRKHVTLQKEEF